jgi:hypothetical protein
MKRYAVTSATACALTPPSTSGRRPTCGHDRMSIGDRTLIGLWGGQRCHESVEELDTGSRRPRRRQRVGNSLVRKLPDHSARVEVLHGLVPLDQRLAEPSVQFKMSTAPGQVTSSLLKQAFQGRSSDKNQVSQPERANLERPSGDVKFEFPARPRSSADHAQAPAVMKLQRVAVADRQPGASLELQRLGPVGC